MLKEKIKCWNFKSGDVLRRYENIVTTNYECNLNSTTVKLIFVPLNKKTFGTSQESIGCKETSPKNKCHWNLYLSYCG